MIPVSPEFLEIIQDSHQISSLIVFYDWDGSPTFHIKDYNTLRDFEPDTVTPIAPQTYDGVRADYADYNAIRHAVESGALAPDLQNSVKAVSGTVTADRKARARRTFSTEIALHEWEDIPVDIASSRVQVWTGVYIGNLSMMVPVGVFRVDEISRLNAGTVSLSGSSLEEYVTDNQWLETGEIAAGSPIIQSIKQIVVDSVPGDVEFDVHAEAAARDTVLAVALPYEVGDTKWDALESLAYDIKCEVYCDPTGKFRIYPRPEPDRATPVIGVQEGADGVLMALNVAVTRDQTYNGWIAMGESTNSDVPPHSAIVLDDDPSSPTRWGGPFGKRPSVYRSKLLDTKDKCREKAEELLLESKAMTRRMDFSAIPNPALEPDDVVQVSMLNGTTELHMITRLEIPMGLGDWMADTLSNKNRDDVINPDRPTGAGP